jgi:hypothetical protein
MAIYPILTPPARLNNISGKAYIKNGYIRKEYEIAVFNSDTTERFHNANITRYGPLKRRGIVLHAAGVNFGSGAGDRPRRAASNDLPHAGAKLCTLHTLLAKPRRLTAFYVHTAHSAMFLLPRFFWHTSCYPSGIAIRMTTQRFHYVKQQRFPARRSADLRAQGPVFNLHGSVQLYLFYRHHVRGREARRLIFHR